MLFSKQNYIYSKKRRVISGWHSSGMESIATSELQVLVSILILNCSLCEVLHVLSMLTWVSFRFFIFLPLSKYIQVGGLSILKNPVVWMNVWICVCMGKWDELASQAWVNIPAVSYGSTLELDPLQPRKRKNEWKKENLVQELK